MTLTSTPLANIFIGDDFMLLAFYILLLAYVVFTGVLYYHWTTYSTDRRINLLTFFIYFVLTVPLILLMALATTL